MKQQGETILSMEIDAGLEKLYLNTVDMLYSPDKKLLQEKLQE